MYAYYSGSHRYLHADDIGGIQTIYGAWGAQLSIRSLDGYNIFSQQWSQLSAYYPNLENYGWNKFTFEWSIPNSVTRISTGGSLVSVYPLSSGSIYIGVRAKGECGYTDWKYQHFNVVTSSGGGGILVPEY